MIQRLATTLAAAALLALAAPASAEIHFLAKQYTRCTACHYSESGGTLLTPYGRLLSNEELSTFRNRSETSREHQSLFGLVQATIGRIEGLDMGLTLRPSRIQYDFGRGTDHMDLWMRSDLQAAFQRGNFTVYGELGRLDTEPAELISREHWLSFKSEGGFGFKVGRFMPAFGLRNVDHTSYNRRELGFDQDDQVYGVELFRSGEDHLVQLSLGPGRAESIWDDDGRQAFTATARAQLDLSNRSALVVSGMYRDASKRSSQMFLGSIAAGFAPTSRLALWGEIDTMVTPQWKGTPSYVVFAEVSYELVRGVWLKYAPQLRTEVANVDGGAFRHALSLQLFPRTHWNLNLTWARDKDRISGAVARTLVLQLHLYL